MSFNYHFVVGYAHSVLTFLVQSWSEAEAKSNLSSYCCVCRYEIARNKRKRINVFLSNKNTKFWKTYYRLGRLTWTKGTSHWHGLRFTWRGHVYCLLPGMHKGIWVCCEEHRACLVKIWRYLLAAKNSRFTFNLRAKQLPVSFMCVCPRIIAYA